MLGTRRPGERMDEAPHIRELDPGRYPMRVSTDRYHCPEYNARERDRLWMRVWQVACRADELPDAGDWIEYRLFDQSFVLVRGKDGVIRGFVNACRHRGNAICSGKGSAARFTCPYHNWSYGLDGALLSVPRPDFDGSIEEFVGSKDDLGLIEISVECFAGFVFVNPDPGAAALTDFLGEAGPMLAAYRLDEMVPVGMNVHETIDCNWKVVMDAFQEAYHVQGVHPELVSIVDISKERFGDFGYHGATTVPFGGKEKTEPTAEQEAAMYRNLPAANFPGIVEVLPRFDELIAPYESRGGCLTLPAELTPRALLQQAVREANTAKGLDVSELTDNQMSDFQFWLLFPNVYMQVRAGESTVIIARPHADSTPGRCTWHVAHYLWLRPEEREAQRCPPVTIPAGDHFPYFLALEQDYQQMERQQMGLNNTSLRELVLTRQEPKVAHFHGTLDEWTGR